MNFSKRFFPKVFKWKMTLCNNNDQTWFSDTLIYARPLGVVKTSPFRFAFQHHPRGPADINAKKNLLDPYIDEVRHI